MPRRYFNWKLAIVLIIGVIVFSAAVFGLRQWRKANSAEEGLILGTKAYEEHRWKDAANELGRYIYANQEDVPVLLKYADAQMKIRPQKQSNIKQAVGAYRAIIRIDKNNIKAATKLIELYLSMGVPGEAELIAQRQLEVAQSPDIRRMYALALAQQRKFDKASVELKTICTENPDQILAYEMLGQLTEQHPELFQESAIYWYDEAVKNNPSSALAYLIRADYYRRNRNKSQALIDMSRAERQDLSDSVVRLRLAREFISLGALDRAERHLEEVQASIPEDQRLWQTMAQLTMMLKSQEKMLTTAENGLKALSSQPWDFMPLAAELFIHSGELERAADCISKLRQEDIAPAIIPYLEGLIAVEKGEISEAVKYWQRSIELGNESVQVKLAIASALSNLGDTQSALNQLRNLVSEKPDSFDGHLALAKLLAQISDWTEAQRHAIKAQELAPENPEPALLLIQARLQMRPQVQNTDIEDEQFWQDIEEQFSELDRTASESLEVSLLKLQIEMQKGNYENAQELVTLLKQDYPSQIRIILAEAELLAAQDKIDEAIDLLNQIVEKFPDTVGPIRFLAVLLDRQDEKEKCEAVILEALGRIDNPVIQRDLTLLLTTFYTRWDQRDKVYPQLQKISAKFPNDIPLKRQLLTCQEVLNEPEKAQQIVDNIKSIEGDEGWQWRYEQAKIWYLSDSFKNRYSQIVSLLQENLLINPNDLESRVLLARTYDKADELQLAIVTYREALNRSPNNIQIVTMLISALYKAREFDQAEELLSRTSQQKVDNVQLQKLQLQNFLRLGELDSASNVLQDLLSNEPDNQGASLALALLKMQQNQFDDSDALLTQLKTQDSNSLVITAAQIQLNIRRDKPEEALRVCNEFVSNQENASAYILRSRTYAALNQSDKAKEDLERAIALEPDNVEVWVSRSDFYRSMGRQEEAVTDIRKALSLEPEDLQIQKRTITLLLSTGQPASIQEASALLAKAMESNPDDTELQFLKANSLLIEGSAPAIESANRILQEITDNQPEISRAWLMLGEIMLRQGQPGKAIDIALRGLSYTPNDRALLLLKARAEIGRSPILGLTTLKALYELDPNNVETALFLAHTHIMVEEPKKAVDIIRKLLITCSPSDTRQCNIALAIALYKQGSKTEAQQIFDSLLEDEPDDSTPFLAYMQLLEEDKLWDELKLRTDNWYNKHPNDLATITAIARDLVSVEDVQAKKIAEGFLQNVLQNNSNHIQAINSLAILMEMTGRYEQSVKLYKKIIELQPQNVVAINNLAWIMCERQSQHQQALQLAQKGLQLAPDYADLIDTRGMIYYRLSDFDKAIEDFSRCVELYPDSTPQTVASRFHLAKAYIGAGQKDKAIRYLEEVLDLELRFGGLTIEERSEARRLFEQLQGDN